MKLALLRSDYFNQDFPLALPPRRDVRRAGRLIEMARGFWLPGHYPENGRCGADKLSPKAERERSRAKLAREESRRGLLWANAIATVLTTADEDPEWTRPAEEKFDA